jgi:hypothetical protein
MCGAVSSELWESRSYSEQVRLAVRACSGSGTNDESVFESHRYTAEVIAIRVRVDCTNASSENGEAPGLVIGWSIDTRDCTLGARGEAYVH